MNILLVSLNKFPQIKIKMKKLFLFLPTLTKLTSYLKTKTPNNNLIDYYGLYGKKVPSYKEDDSYDKRPIWKKKVNNYMLTTLLASA